MMNLNTYQIWKTENREEGFTHDVGIVEAENEKQALELAGMEVECHRTCHLWVEVVTCEVSE